MDDVLYREEILDHYYCSPHRGHLEDPDLHAELDNPFCGDRLGLGLKLDADGRIRSVRFDGHGCVISQASASILAENLEGMGLEEARSVSADQMLQWLRIPLTPTRLKCGLLAWRTLQRAIAPEPPTGPRSHRPDPPTSSTHA